VPRWVELGRLLNRPVESEVSRHPRRGGHWPPLEELGAICGRAPLGCLARRAPKERYAKRDERHPNEIVGVDSVATRKNEDHPVPTLRAEPDNDRADKDRCCADLLSQEARSVDALAVGQITGLASAYTSPPHTRVSSALVSAS
jgi:hypothetical protein